MSRGNDPFGHRDPCDHPSMALTTRARALVESGGIVLVLVLVSCAKKEDVAKATPTPSLGSAAPSSASIAPSSVAASASAPPPPPPVPSGVVTLVLQHVSADCGVGGWAGTKERVHSLGTDVIVVIKGDDPSEKPQKEFAFCPTHLPDGGPQKPQLSLWQYCRAFPSCRKVATHSGGESRVEIQCGKENLVLESDDKRTILRGSFGEREIAPHPMRIAPVKKEERHAMVDC